MAENRSRGRPGATPIPRHFRIFLSSPRDVADERRLARKLIKERLPVDPFLRDRATFER